MATPPRKLPSELAGGSTITRLIEDRAPREGRLPLGLGLHYIPLIDLLLFRHVPVDRRQFGLDARAELR